MKTISSVCIIIFLFIGLFTISCGGVQKPLDPGPRGTIRFKGDPPDSILEIDETRLGPIKMFEKSGVLLRPGPHRIIVKKEGFFTEYLMVQVIKDQKETIEIKLRSVPE